MALTIGMVTTDTFDARAAATWWAEQTGGTIVQDHDGWFVVVDVPGGPALGFQRVEDPTPGKNRLHLDLVADELDGEIERLVAAGASLVDDRTMGDFRWVTLADPQGSVFCVAER